MADGHCDHKVHVQQHDPRLLCPVDPGEHEEAESGGDGVHRDLTSDETHDPAESGVPAAGDRVQSTDHGVLRWLYSVQGPAPGTSRGLAPGLALPHTVLQTLSV